MLLALASEARLTGLSQGARAVCGEQVGRQAGRRVPPLRRRHHDRLRRDLLRQQRGLGEELLGGGEAGVRAAGRPEQLSQGLAREQRAHVAAATVQRLQYGVCAARGRQSCSSTRVPDAVDVGQVLQRAVAGYSGGRPGDARGLRRARPACQLVAPGSCCGAGSAPARARPSWNDCPTSVPWPTAISAATFGSPYGVTVSGRPAVPALSSVSQADAAFAHRGCVRPARRQRPDVDQEGRIDYPGDAASSARLCGCVSATEAGRAGRRYRGSAPARWLAVRRSCPAMARSAAAGRSAARARRSSRGTAWSSHTGPSWQARTADRSWWSPAPCRTGSGPGPPAGRPRRPSCRASQPGPGSTSSPWRQRPAGRWRCQIAPGSVSVAGLAGWLASCCSSATLATGVVEPSSWTVRWLSCSPEVLRSVPVTVIVEPGVAHWRHARDRDAHQRTGPAC